MLGFLVLSQGDVEDPKMNHEPPVVQATLLGAPTLATTTLHTVDTRNMSFCIIIAC